MPLFPGLGEPAEHVVKMLPGMSWVLLGRGHHGMYITESFWGQLGVVEDSAPELGGWYLGCGEGQVEHGRNLHVLCGSFFENVLQPLSSLSPGCSPTCLKGKVSS
jgi:hypothetical protein